MSMTARAVVVRTPGAPAAVEEIVVEDPGPGEVLVRVLASGVCHTDLHAKLGNFTKEFPFLLGHEATGVVEKLGPGVAHPAVGTQVVLSWRSPCGVCRACANGRPIHCVKPLVAAPRMKTKDGLTLGRVLGVGSFTTHTVVHAAQAIPIATDVPAEVSCLIGCAVATGTGAVLNAAAPPPGATIAVWGCGAIGMSVILGAKLRQASRIIAVDLSPRKLELARQFGATDLVDASEGDPTKKVRALTGVGVDFAFEAVGLPITLQQAAASVDQGGLCVLIGVPAPRTDFTLSMVRFFYGQGHLKSTFAGDCLPTRDFPMFGQLWKSGALPIDRLVTGKIALGDVDAAFAAMERGEALRSVIVV
jgi:S-(hydroxymethyl)mycothiol dehydrogenase